MNNLFDNTEKLVKFHGNQSHELHIKKVRHPFDQTWIDEQRAKKLGFIFNGYYRNCYGGLIPLHIAANKGLIQLTTNDRIQIEYHSRQYPILTTLTIHQVYDGTEQCMISCRQAIDQGYLNLEFFSYSMNNLTMTIHEAFSRGLIIGELRTNVTESKAMNLVNEKRDVEYEHMFSSLTNIINSLSEFRNTIKLIDQCELTSDGFIREKTTGKCYLLTQAIELGLVAIKDIYQMDHAKNQSTLVNDTMSSTMNMTRAEDDIMPYFSDTFILELLKPTTSSSDESEKSEIHMTTNTKQFLPPIKTC